VFDGNKRIVFLCVFAKDLIEIICSLQISMEHQTRRLQDLEDYLDTLLVRVIETTPRILQNPYMSCKTHAKLR
jgi:Rab11 family-interacting protein 1/2/5